MNKNTLQVINLEVDNEVNKFMNCVNIVRCNISVSVENFINLNCKYVIELPDTKEILNVICTGKGTRGADMRIKSMMKNGIIDTEFDEYTISYQYEYFDSIHFTSFSYREKCIVYISINDLVT